MTDHLEPYRRMARSIRFFPPFSQTQPSQESVTQLAKSVPVVDLSLRKTTTDASVEPALEPSIDPSEHAAALVHEAVSKPTVLPVTYSIPEDIGDRISRLSQPKPVKAVIIAPKIPQPDFSETSAQMTSDRVSSGIDLSEHTAALVHKAVSRPTVLPATYKIPEDIGDRISRLSSPQVTDTDDVVDETSLDASAATLDVPEAPKVEQTHSDDLVEGIANSLDVEQTADEQVETTVVAEPVTTPELKSENITDADVPVAEAEEVQEPTILEETEDSSVGEAVAVAVQHPEIERHDSVEEANEAEEPTISEQTEDSSVGEAVAVAVQHPEIELHDAVEQANEAEEPTISEQTAEDSSVNEAVATPIQHPESERQDSEPVAELATSEAAVVDTVEPLTTEAPAEPTPVQEEKVSDIQTVEITCPKCESTNIRKNGHRQGKQRYACKDCGREFITPDSAKAEDKPKLQESSGAETSKLKASKPDTVLSHSNSASAKGRGKKKAKPKGFGSSKAD